MHARDCPASCSYDATQEAQVLHALLDADHGSAATGNGVQLEGEGNRRIGTFGLGFLWAGDDDAA